MTPMQSLRHYVANLMSHLSPEDKHRWTTGWCHAFALALVQHLRSIEPRATYGVLMGTRHGIGDTGRRRRTFTHAAVMVELDGQDVCFDCAFDGIDARLAWESKWFFDALTPQLIAEFEQYGSVDWRHPDETRSEFDWEYTPATIPDVTRKAWQIDKSQAVSEEEVNYAAQQLANAHLKTLGGAAA